LRRTLLISAGPGEWRAAWLEDGNLAELHVERGDIAPPGSIHLGRVIRRVAGLDAALVDIGEERPGFLPLRGPLAAGLNEGARIITQVRREAQRDKGALLAPRAGDADARLADRAAGLQPPAQLDPPPGFAAALALRLPGMPDEILSDDPAIVPDLRSAFPSSAVAHAAREEWPLDFDAAFDAALMPSLALPGGGAIWVAETRAAVLIDVDTGSPETGSAARTARAVNLAAAAAIARELRLRQLGGGIIVDFAALDGRRERERVRRAMDAALSRDPARPQVLGWSRLGHLELVRPRHLRSLAAAMLEPSGIGRNPATLALEALRAVAREARARPAAEWRLVVTAAVGAALQGAAAPALRALEARLGRSIAVAIRPGNGNDASAFDIASR
jgi:Ribonuclease G/E